MEVDKSPSPLYRCSYDILFAICKAVGNLPRADSNQQQSPQAFAQTCRRIRHFMAPVLYQTINIGPEWDWTRAMSALESVEECQLVKQYARKIVVSLYIDTARWSPAPPEDLPNKLVRVLASLRNVDTIMMSLPVVHIETFRTAFTTAHIIFTNVLKVGLGVGMDWIIPMCPAVNSISAQGPSNSIKTLGYGIGNEYPSHMVNVACDTKNLQHFGMRDIEELEIIESLLTLHPNISSLALSGPYLSNYLTGKSIIDLAPLYGRFPNLKTIALKNASELDVGFFPLTCGKPCKNGGAKTLRQAEEKVASIMFEACAKLEVLWIGPHTRATCKRTREGKVWKLYMEKGERDKFFTVAW